LPIWENQKIDMEHYSSFWLGRTEKWQPNLKEAPQKNGSKTLLWQAFQKIQPAELMDRLKDDHGIFALNLDKGVLVAKKEPYGYIVSAHMRAVVSAFNQKKNLIMYIGSQDKFYEFNPNEIMEKSENNIRGGEVMMNFNIKLGKRREVL